MLKRQKWLIDILRSEFNALPFNVPRAHDLILTKIREMVPEKVKAESLSEEDAANSYNACREEMLKRLGVDE